MNTETKIINKYCARDFARHTRIHNEKGVASVLKGTHMLMARNMKIMCYAQTRKCQKMRRRGFRRESSRK